MGIRHRIVPFEHGRRCRPFGREMAGPAFPGGSSLYGDGEDRWMRVSLCDYFHQSLSSYKPSSQGAIAVRAGRAGRLIVMGHVPVQVFFALVGCTASWMTALKGMSSGTL